MFCVCIIWLTERKVDHLYQWFFWSLFDSDCDAVTELEDILERGTIPTTEGVKSIGQQLLLLQDQVGHLSHRSQYHVRSKQGTYIPKEAGLPFLFTLVPLYNISDESDESQFQLCCYEGRLRVWHKLHGLIKHHTYYACSCYLGWFWSIHLSYTEFIIVCVPRSTLNTVHCSKSIDFL